MKINRLLAVSLLAISAHAYSQVPGDAWLSFDFENKMQAAGTVGGAVKIKFTRDCDVLLPGNLAFAKDQPCIVNGKSGKGLFMGAYVRNLLSPELSDFNFGKDDKLPLAALNNAKMEIQKGTDALFGESSLMVDASNSRMGGVSIPFSVEGGTAINNSMKIYVFSFYIKGEGMAQLNAKIAKGVTAEKKNIKLSKDWQRVSTWVAASEPGDAEIKLINLLGARCMFQMDGLKLEDKTFAGLQSLVYPQEMKCPYGTDFSASAWTKGAGNLSGKEEPKPPLDSLVLDWEDPELFPYKEGSVSVWVSPGFAKGDSEDHPIFARNHIFYQLTFQAYSELSFYRANDDKSAPEAGSVRKPRPDFTPGSWHLLTATWSNKDSSANLYYDGELLGKNQCSNAVTTENGRFAFIGLWGGASLNGCIDDLTVYSRALKPEEIKKMFESGSASK